MTQSVRPRGLRVLLIVCLASAACHSEHRDPVTTVASPLNVGVELPLATPVQLPGAMYPSSARVACNGAGRCLVAWSQMFKNNDYVVLARRIDATGPLDPQVIVLGSPATVASKVSVGARDSGDFLVGWSNAGDSKVSLARIDAATGAVLDSPFQINDASAGIAQILLVDGGYVVVYGSTDGDAGASPVWRATRIQAATVQDAPGLLLGPRASATTFAAGSGQLAIASAAGLVRFSLTAGVLDSTPIAFNTYAVGDPPGIAFDGSNYLLTWTFSGKTYAGRVRASDGANLDPPDDFNQIAGAHLIATGSPVGTTKTTFDGTNFLSFWIATGTNGVGMSLVATRVSTAGVRVQGATTTPYEIALSSVLGGEVDVSARAGAGLVIWAQNNIGPGVQGVFMQTAGGVAPSAVTTPLGISYYGASYVFPTVASNGHDFLLAYSGGAVAVDGVTGAVIGAVMPFANNGSSDSMTAVWTGSVYLVVTPYNSSIWLSVLSCSGQRMGNQVQVASSAMSGVACNADRCAIAYYTGTGIFARRVNASDGTFVDTQPIGIHTGTLTSPPVVAADTKPTAAMRTFLVVFPSGGQIVARRLRSDLGTVIAATTIATTTATAVRATSDGTQFLVAWVDGGRVRATLVDAVSGLPTLTTPLDVAAGVELRSATFDGTSFLLTWRTATELRGARISPTGVNLDATDFLISSTGAVDISAAGAAPFGRTLAVYQVEDVRALSDVFHGRFIDNELGAGTSGRGPACSSGGTGGAGGATGGSGGGAAGGAGGRGGGGGTGGNAGSGAAGAGGATGGSGGGTGGTGGATGGTGGATGGSGAAGGTGGASSGRGGAGGAAGSGGGAGTSAAAGSGGDAAGGRGGTGGSATAGTAGTTGAAGATASSGGGCGCEVAGNRSGFASLLVPITMAIATRRRRARTRSQR